MRFSKGVLFALVALVCVFAVVYFWDRDTVTLPDEVEGYSREQLIEGDQANAILNRMHSKDVTPRKNLIGIYRGETVVYLSTYRSPDEAQQAYEKMRSGIEKGNLIFDGYRPVTVQQIQASFCVGQGQHHYFFVRENRLYWIAADSTAAATIVRSFVRRL